MLEQKSDGTSTLTQRERRKAQTKLFGIVIQHGDSHFFTIAMKIINNNNNNKISEEPSNIIVDRVPCMWPASSDPWHPI